MKRPKHFILGLVVNSPVQECAHFRIVLCILSVAYFYFVIRKSVQPDNLTQVASVPTSFKLFGEAKHFLAIDADSYFFV